MKHFILGTLFLLLFFTSTIGQSSTIPTEGPLFYFNSFQDYSGKNVDSSLYYVRLLAADSNYTGILQELLHNSFAQVFQRRWELRAKDASEKADVQKRADIGYRILEGMMSDTNKSLVKAPSPIYYWVKIQQNGNDSKKLFELSDQFIATQLSANDIYQNRIGRYALLIYKVISQKNELRNVAELLFSITFNKLKENQVLANADSASRKVLEKKAWYRYLFAYCNFILATRYAEKKNSDAGKYYLAAFDYSPDLSDKRAVNGYFYDMYFLMEKEKDNFREDFFNYLQKNNTDKKETLSTLLRMALADPAYKDKLELFYNTNFSGQEKFDAYWLNSINQNFKKAPEFSVNTMGGTKFSAATHKGKWMLIDFWGTWCVPCRKEHPDLQKFYNEISVKDTASIVLLTVACHDREADVRTYMSQYKYSFPVAMADRKIESLYLVNSYPKKILITPQGKYLVVPFGIDWVNFVKRYAGLREKEGEKDN